MDKMTSFSEYATQKYVDVILYLLLRSKSYILGATPSKLGTITETVNDELHPNCRAVVP